MLSECLIIAMGFVTMSISDKDASDQKVKEKTNEMRAKYPIFTAILKGFQSWI